MSLPGDDGQAMPKNIKSTDVEVDPVAAWRGVLPEPQPADLAEEAEVLTVTSDAAAPPARRFCAQCGAEGVTAARFCHACGTPLEPAPVVSSFAVEQASRVTAADMESFRPKPEAALTPAERAERERLHLLAVKEGQRDPGVQYVKSTSPDAILIHVVSDGFTFAGRVWFRGEELEIGPDHPRWAEAQRWINMDDAAQYAYYGRVRFRKGPWPGRRSFTDGAGSYERVAVGRGADGEPVFYHGPSVDELRSADLKERQRGRAVPAPSF